MGDGALSAKVKELIPGNAHLHKWLDMARERIHFQGLPARICWVGLGDRHGLERQGLLTSANERLGRTERRVYRATAAGRKALAAAKTKVRELFGELFEDDEGGGA